ncbi:MAG: NAD(P)-binding protein [Acidimicrobiales bacterium]
MEKFFAITLPAGSSLGNRTGNWREERPVFVDLLPPCNDACPAGENVQGWLYAAAEGDYEGAWRAVMADNPLPAVTGRACYRPCEAACNRAKLDEAVSINALERFVGDFAIERGLHIEPPAVESGKRALVVGAGPAGLSAAYHLRRLGHAVVIYEAAPLPGGMMRYGLPEYRLPRRVLDAEIARIIDLGIELQLRHPVEDLAASLEEAILAGRSFDAVFLGVGAQVAKREHIPAGGSARVINALALLRSVNEGGVPALGRHVVVYGGGDAAVDAARTAKRLGADEAVIVCRFTQELMPAHPEGLEDALGEGIKVKWLSAITHVAQGSVLLEDMELDEAGLPQPTGEVEELDADALVLDLGQEADLSLVARMAGVRVHKGWVSVGPTMMTGEPGVFAGGDMVGRDMTLPAAIGHGKLAARAMHAYLAGSELTVPRRHQLAGPERLNTWYYSDAARSVPPRPEAAKSVPTFDEVKAGLDAESAVFEARRCMSCGNCFECDNCLGVCPDSAVLKLADAVVGGGPGAEPVFASGGKGRRYVFDYDYCKGCGLCAAECPCGAIVMEPEPT